MRLLDIANAVVLKKEKREPKVYTDPRMNPSDLSAYVRDTRRVRYAGRCMRALVFKLMGVPSAPIGIKTARIFRLGRFFEQELTDALREAGLLVASGVRKSYIRDMMMSFELDVVAIDPQNGTGIIGENKTTKNEWAMKAISEGGPKLENLMQLCVYLDYVKTGKRLKELIRECQREKDIDDEFGDITLNRIEVVEENLAKMSDGPIVGKLFYEDRETCSDGEFDVTLQKGSDGNTYPVVNGVPHTEFCMEAVYARREELRAYWNGFIREAKQILAQSGVHEPFPPTTDFGPNYRDPGYVAAKNLYWSKVGQLFETMPPEKWPACDYEFKYSQEKLVQLKAEGLLKKGEITSMNKGERLGDFNCNYCDWQQKCVAARYPEYRNMFMAQTPEQRVEIF